MRRKGDNFFRIDWLSHNYVPVFQNAIGKIPPSEVDLEDIRCWQM